jgi:membrane protease YdiL (CAAX protease family)
MSIARKKILVFLLLTFASSSVFYYLIASSGSIQPYAAGLMWCPGVAALITQLVFQHNLRGLGWSLGRFKYLLVSYGLPAIYGGIIYGVAWLTGLGKFVPAEMGEWIIAQWNVGIHSPYIAVVVYTLVMATLGILMSGLTAVGEEIGWRGLLVPELAKETSFTKTALISGVIWAIWHSPGILFADYNNFGAPIWFGLICFVISIVGISFAFTWLRLRSGSLWTGVILHASHNLFIQGIFTPLTADTGITAYVIDEFGLGLALLAVLTAWLFWRKRGELPEVSGNVRHLRQGEA